MLMQINVNEKDPTEIFQILEEKIRERFFAIIEKLISRRDELIAKLQQIKLDCQIRDQARKKSEQELESLRKQVEKLPTDNPFASEFKKSCLEKLEIDRKKFEISVVPNLLFTCNSINLERKIKELGNVQNASDFYQSKQYPILWNGHKGSRLNEYDSPRAIALDNKRDRLYIADSENKRIVICSKYGEQISEISRDLNSPYGVALGSFNDLYVTDDANHALLKYSVLNSDLVQSVTKFGKKIENFNYPKGLDTDSNGHIFIADSRNNRVVVLGPHFELKDLLGKGALKEPLDVKVRNGKQIYVLDRSREKLHVFSIYGIKESARIDLTSMFQPMFFTFDRRENLIVSDYHRGCVKIFGQDGLLLQSIGKQGKDKGEFIRPTGVAISDDGLLIAMSESQWLPLQIF